MKVAVIVGTRPEIIKMSPIVDELERRRIQTYILHSGQHYSFGMDRVFFQQLGIRPPDSNIGVGGKTDAIELGRMLIGMESSLLKWKPDVVLVQGDTNTVLAGALVSSRLSIIVGHVEAGLRSYDRRMPEEVNRTLTDHIADYLFAPTSVSRSNLLMERVDPTRIHVTGNTIVDVVTKHWSIIKRMGRPQVAGIDGHEYALATLHRRENVDRKEVFTGLMRALEMVSARLGIPILYPMHPRARKRLEEFGMSVDRKKVRLLDALGYFDFLNLEANSKLVLTDSGGVQEEACILSVPCVTMRENTERPETVRIGANVIAGTQPQSIVKKALEMVHRERSWKNPYGGGNAAKKIVGVITGGEHS